jgi:hypothetical protein
MFAKNHTDDEALIIDHRSGLINCVNKYGSHDEVIHSIYLYNLAKPKYRSTIIADAKVCRKRK